MNRTIKFRAWDKAEKMTNEYMDWCKKNEFSMGGDTKVLEKQEKDFETETGLKPTNKKGEMIYDIHVSDKGKYMKCNICGRQYDNPSLGGPGVCPSCDCGYAPKLELDTKKD